MMVRGRRGGGVDLLVRAIDDEGFFSRGWGVGRVTLREAVEECG